MGESELQLDDSGNGTFKEHVISYIVASANRELQRGTVLNTLEFLKWEDEHIVDVDFDGYVKHITRMKTPPAFDALDLSSPENELFGTATIKARHFTRFSKENGINDGELADDKVISMMNPMNYIGTGQSDTAEYWRIRHGAADRDTSLAIPAILSAMLENHGFTVDFALPWGVPHSGDYDQKELFAWVHDITN